MRTVFFLIICLSLISCNKNITLEQKNIKIGVVSDCQYCDCEIKLDRYYKKSPQRLKDAVNELNLQELNYSIHLGDFIDKDFKSFDSIFPIWEQLRSKSYHVLGNHDFEVVDSLKKIVPTKMNLTNRYYSFDLNNWKFIILDGTDLSMYASLDSLKIKEAEALFLQIQKDTLPYAQTYNGGLSLEQMNWVKQELNLADKNDMNVGFFNHFPARPIDHHNFWNTNEFISLISEYKNVKVFMNGHNHAGAYVEKNGVHFITFKGMVDTKDTSSFAIVEITTDSIFINGYGREENRRLKIN